MKEFAFWKHVLQTEGTKQELSGLRGVTHVHRMKGEGYNVTNISPHSESDHFSAPISVNLVKVEGFMRKIKSN